MRCSVLQCVALCCSALKLARVPRFERWCVAMGESVLQGELHCVAVCLQCVTLCYSALKLACLPRLEHWCVAVGEVVLQSESQCMAERLQCVAVCCSVLQCPETCPFASPRTLVCCSEWECVAGRCRALYTYRDIYMYLRIHICICIYIYVCIDIHKIYMCTYI